jgi:hypothetical protein
MEAGQLLLIRLLLHLGGGRLLGLDGLAGAGLLGLCHPDLLGDTSTRGIVNQQWARV